MAICLFVLFLGVAASADSSADAPAGVKPVVPRSGEKEVAQVPTEPESAGWQARFAWGMYYSAKALQAGEDDGPWTRDAGSGAGAPKQMLRAEELLRAACEEAPEQQQKAHVAQWALQVYYHAKWLAERSQATAAEWRYREAERLARSCRRTVLAAHALSRLGYFLVHWRREDEAREILAESERLNTKANPLAFYLIGVLERKASGADVARLMAAEDRILLAEEQPSEDLEVQRRRLSEQIKYWRRAREGPSHCFDAPDIAHVTICLVAHFFRYFWEDGPEGIS